MHATGIGGARQAKFASGISTQYVGDQLAFFDERFGIGGQTIAIEGRTAQRAHQVWTLIQGQPAREQALTHGPLKER
ncbi:hypothetical protein D3C79_829460 [compost metagenome]